MLGNSCAARFGGYCADARLRSGFWDEALSLAGKVNFKSHLHSGQRVATE